MPDEPSVLSNLGLSYALSKNLPEAEETLRRAAAQPGPSRRCGRTSRSSSACRAASRRPRRSRAATCRPSEAAANVAYLRQMLAQQSAVEKGQARLAAGADDRLLA